MCFLRVFCLCNSELNYHFHRIITAGDDGITIHCNWREFIARKELESTFVTMDYGEFWQLSKMLCDAHHTRSAHGCLSVSDISRRPDGIGSTVARARKLTNTGKHILIVYSHLVVIVNTSTCCAAVFLTHNHPSVWRCFVSDFWTILITFHIKC